MPFTQRFDVLGAGDRRVYYGAVLATAIASVLLIAPSAHHRLRFRAGSKERLLLAANSLAVAGIFVLALAIGAVVYVITSVLYAVTLARIVAAALTGATVLLWFGLPFTFDRDRDRTGTVTHGVDPGGAGGGQHPPAGGHVEAGRRP